MKDDQSDSSSPLGNPLVPHPHRVMLEALIRDILQNVLDDKLRRVVIALWVTVLGGTFTGAGTLIYMGVQWGSLSYSIESNERTIRDHSQSSSLHIPADHLYQQFVTRSEWVTSDSRNRADVVEIKAGLHRVEDKLDKISKLP